VKSKSRVVKRLVGKKPTEPWSTPQCLPLNDAEKGVTGTRVDAPSPGPTMVRPWSNPGPDQSAPGGLPPEAVGPPLQSPLLASPPGTSDHPSSADRPDPFAHLRGPRRTRWGTLCWSDPTAVEIEAFGPAPVPAKVNPTPSPAAESRPARPENRTIAEACAPGDPEKKPLITRVDIALQVLVGMLSDQGTPFLRVIECAAELGVSMAPIFQAAELLKVIKTTVDGQEVWSLEARHV
jgi:hypothetical protein